MQRQWVMGAERNGPPPHVGRGRCEYCASAGLTQIIENVGKTDVKTPNNPQQSGGLPGLGQAAGKATPLPGLGAAVNVNAQRVQSGYQLERMMNEAIEHHRSGRREEAERLYRTILQQVPDQPDALNLLGVLAVDGGRKDMAIDLIGRALAKRPTDPNIQNNMGNTLQSVRRYEEAVAHFECAIALKPDFVEAIFNMARTIRQQGDLAESRHYYERVLELNPRHSSALAGLARLWEDEGDMAKAEEGYIKTMVEFPEMAGGYRGLSHVRKWKGGEPEIAEMHKRFDAENARPKERVGLAYALGKVYDDMKDFDKAFEYYKFANDNSGIEHDHNAVVAQYDELIRVFTKEFLSDNSGHGHPSKQPILIVGMPRSGTTLTEQIFSGHHLVHGAGELEYMARTMRRAFQISNIQVNGPAAYQGLTKEAWRLLGYHYTRLVAQKAPDSPRVVDKMPHNYEQLGLISLALPNAKIIHIKRQAPDTCLSCYMHDFNEFHSYNRDLRNAGLYYRQYERLMAHWKEVLPIEIFELSYEDLVMDQEATIRKMLDFCELEWDDNCLNFHKLKRKVVTPSNTQVRQPMYTRSKDRWRNYGENLRPLLDALEWDEGKPQDEVAE